MNLRTGSILVVLLVLLLMATGCETAGPALPPVVFLSDFGQVDDAVAICKGVMLTIAPGLEIVDLTHDVTPYSIAEGARFLAHTAPYYPPGTVFVGVVDPGVGSARKPIVVRSGKGQFFVVPDNGLVTLVAERDRVAEAREITNPDWMIGARLSSTFHGRDIFSPAGAHLARGAPLREVGPVVEGIVRIEIRAARQTAGGITGEVVALDGPYGNLVTSLPGGTMPQLGYELGDRVAVELDGRTIELPYVTTFSDVPEGQALLYVNSRDTVGLAINMGNFAKQHGVTPPVTIVILAAPH